jgi:hypothetical protein
MNDGVNIKDRFDNRASILPIIFYSILLVLISHEIFFLAAPYIWAHNIIIDPALISPPLRQWYVQPRDGIETPVVYVLMLVMVYFSIIIHKYLYNIGAGKIVLSIALMVNFSKLTANYLYKVNSAKTIFFLALAILSIFFFKRVDFLPPFSAVSAQSRAICMGAVAVLTLFSILFNINKRLCFVGFAIVLLPICFLSYEANIENYEYILDPSLKLLDGFSLSEIYFQYDLFMSLLAIPLLALKSDPEYLKIVAQLSLYLYFMFLVFFLNKFFKNKLLVIPFICTVIAIRIYSPFYDPTRILQITPLRLDLWIIPLFFAYRSGLFSWKVGLSLGALTILHRNFGLIYSLAYVQTIVGLLIIEFIDSSTAGSTGSFKGIAMKYVRLSAKPLIIIFISFVIASIAFGSVGMSDAAKIYQEFGIGFDRIAQNSFFWQVFVLVIFCTLLLFKIRSLFSTLYFQTSIFIVFLCIGNLIYFLGRSHESNLTWISGAMFLLAFICIDLLVSYYENVSYFKRAIVAISPYLLFIACVYFYSQPITDRIHIQYNQLVTGKRLKLAPTDYHIGELQLATKNSSKVYVLGGQDFWIYYYGNYKPIAYLTPYPSWVYLTEQVKYMQNLLDDGYYLVSPSQSDEVIAMLKFDNNVSAGPYFVISKNPRVNVPGLPSS